MRKEAVIHPYSRPPVGPGNGTPALLCPPTPGNPHIKAGQPFSASAPSVRPGKGPCSGHSHQSGMVNQPPQDRAENGPLVSGRLSHGEVISALSFPAREAGCGLPASSASHLLPSDPSLRVWPPWLMKEGGWLKTQETESADHLGVDLLATVEWHAHVLRSCPFALALLV